MEEILFEFYLMRYLIQTFDYFCEMTSIIGNKLASLHELAKQGRRVTAFARFLRYEIAKKSA